MNWRREIRDLHDFFEAYFLDPELSLSRVEEALEPEFTIVSPAGVVSDREETLAALESAHGGSVELHITTHDHRLIVSDHESLVAVYIERHETLDGRTERHSTAVFKIDPEGPNGLRWLRVHETWI